MFLFKSLRTKTIISALLPLSFVLVAVAINVFHGYERVARVSARQRETELVRVSAYRLSEGLRRYSRILQNIAGGTDFRSLETSRLYSALERVQPQLAVFDAGVEVYNRQGNNVLHRQGTVFPIKSKFNEVHRTLRPVFSNVLEYPSSGEYGKSGEEVIVVGVPIVGSEGNFNGLLVGKSTVKFSLLGGLYAKVLELKAGLSGFAYLVDGNGRVIYHRHSSMIGKRLKDVLPVMRVTSGETGAVITKDAAGELIISGFAPVPGTEWGVITQEKWENIVEPIRVHGHMILSLLAVGGILTCMLIFLSIGRILKPVKQLAMGAQRIAEGDYGYKVAAKTGDEIEILAGQFNEMSGALKESFSELEQRVVECRQGEEALRESEEKYRKILESMEEGYYEVDLAGNMTFFNDSLSQILGYSEGELLGMNNRDYMDKEFSKKVYKTFNKVHETGRPVKAFDWKIIRKDGTERWLEASVSLIKDTVGRAVGFQGVCRDVTERKLDEVELARHREHLEQMVEERTRELTEFNLKLSQEIAERKQAEHALRFTQFAVDHAAEAAFWMGSDARFIYVNEAASAALGYSRKELLSKTVHDIAPAFSNEAWLEHWQAVREHGSLAIESSYRTKDGKIFPAEIRSNYFEFEGQGFCCVFAHDITDRKRAQEELHRQNEYLSALHDTSLGLISRLDLDELLSALVIRAGQLVGAPHGFIYLAEPGSKKLELKVDIGPPGVKIPDFSEPGEGLAGKVWQTGKPMVVEDYDSWPGRSPDYDYNLLGSTVGVPLTRTRRSAGLSPQTAGVIGLAFDTSSNGKFGDAEVELLNRFAQLASIALDNARLYQESQRRAMEMSALFRLSAELAATLDETEVCRRVVNGLHDTLAYDVLALYLLDENTGDRVHAASIGYENPHNRLTCDQGLGGRPLLDGELQYVPDVTRDPCYFYGAWGSEVDVPVKIGGKVIGVLIAEKRETHAFSQNDFEVLTAAAQQAGLAIEKARLLAEERQRADELDALRTTMADITADLELPTLLQSIVERASSLLDATGGELGLYDEVGREIRIVVSHNLGGDHIGTRQAIGEGAMGRVAETGEALIIEDYNTWKGRVPAYADTKIHGSLNAPLEVGNRLVGVISIATTDPDRRFGPTDVHLINLFAQQAAIAIENAHLFAEVQGQKQYSESLVQNSPVAIVSVDLNGNVSSWNPAAEKLFGYTRAEALGQDLDGLVTATPDMLAEAQDITQKMMDGMQVFHTIRRRARQDGTLVDVEILTVPGDRQDIGHITIYHDITELKRTEQALQKSQAKYRDLVENANCIILEMDTRGNIIFFNRFAQDFFGYSEAEILGCNVLDTIVPATDSDGKDLDVVIKDLVSHPHSYSDNENENMRRNGERVWVAWANRAIYDHQGRLSEILSIGIDRTEQKRTESQLQEAKKAAEAANRAKSAFLANMSHELRTPLNAVLGYTELILDKIYGDIPEKVQGVLERVTKNGRHLLSLINDVLDISKIEAAQLTLSINQFSMKEVVHTVITGVEPLAAEKNLELKTTVHPNLPTGKGDEQRIVQVILNIVGNAIKFTEEGEVKIEVNESNGAFIISVSDTGQGLSEADLQKIFEEFHQVDSSSTRQKGGTGLGLSISKKIIEMHGGEIWAESKLGQGSTFWFTLPFNGGNKQGNHEQVNISRRRP
jgi:PAS domain S-box-containing protein